MKVSDLAKSIFDDTYVDLVCNKLKDLPLVVRNQYVYCLKHIFVAGFMEGFNYCSELEGTNWGYENDYHR